MLKNPKNKWFAYLGLALAGVLIFFGAAVAIIWHRLNHNPQYVANELSVRLGVVVHVGELRLERSPRTYIDLADVTVGEPAFLTLDHLRVRIRPRLVGGSLKLVEIAAAGLHVSRAISTAPSIKESEASSIAHVEQMERWVSVLRGVHLNDLQFALPDHSVLYVDDLQISDEKTTAAPQVSFVVHMDEGSPISGTTRLVFHKHVAVLEDIHLKSDVGQATGQLTFGGTNKGSFDLKLKFDDVSQGVIPLIPAEVMGPSTSAWLVHRLIKAQCQDGSLNLAGDAEEVTVFQLKLSCHDVHVKALDHWSMMTSDQVDFSIQDGKMLIKSAHAALNPATVDHLKVEIADLSAEVPKLTVDLDINQAVLPMIKALQKSDISLIPNFIAESPFLVEGQVEGHLAVEVQLDDRANGQVRGDFKLRDGRILTKSERTVLIDKIQSSVSLTPTSLDMTSFTGFAKSESSFASGQTLLTGQGHLDLAAKDMPYHFAWKSDLMGWRFQYLPSLIKEPTAAKDLKVDVLGDAHVMQIQSAVGKDFFAHANISFDADDWGVMVSSQAASPQILKSQVVFDLPDLRGMLDLRNLRSVVAKFERVHLDRSSSPDVSPVAATRVVPIDPRKVPAVDLAIQEFKFDGMNLGAVGVLTEAIPAGLKVKRVAIEQGDFSQYNTTGLWTVSPRGNLLELKGQIFCRNAGRAAQTLGWYDGLENLSGQMTFDATWLNPFASELGDAKLNTDVKLERGLITQGDGRLAALSNILTLNLIEIQQRKVYLEQVRGKLTLNHHKIQLKDFEVQIPALRLKSQGELDLDKQEIDVETSMLLKILNPVDLVRNVLQIRRPKRPQDANDSSSFWSLDKLTEQKFHIKETFGKATNDSDASGKPRTSELMAPAK